MQSITDDFFVPKIHLGHHGLQSFSTDDKKLAAMVNIIVEELVPQFVTGKSSFMGQNARNAALRDASNVTGQWPSTGGRLHTRMQVASRIARKHYPDVPLYFFNKHKKGNLRELQLVLYRFGFFFF